MLIYSCWRVCVDYTSGVIAVVSALRCRLSGTTATRDEGRLEVLHKHRWRSVCGDSFSDVEARVVCFSLGYHECVTRIHYINNNNNKTTIYKAQ